MIRAFAPRAARALLAACALSCSLAAGAAGVRVPGVGVTLPAPAGMGVAPVGPSLVDPGGETMLVVTVSASGRSVEADPVWRALFPHPPESISTPALKGRLYRRTRQQDRGAYDGWFLAVERGGKRLGVLATYTGASPERFEKLRASLAGLAWDDTQADPQAAMGVRAAVAGMALAPGATGILSYSAAGKDGRAGPSLTIGAAPAPPVDEAALNAATCRQMIATAFGAAQYPAPVFTARGPHQTCEAWSDTGRTYAAIVRVANGGLLNVFGGAPAGQFAASLRVFRNAVATLQPTRATR